MMVSKQKYMSLPKNTAPRLLSDYLPINIAPRTDELGHLLGADHDRASSLNIKKFAHARRYCEEGG